MCVRFIVCSDRPLPLVEDSSTNGIFQVFAVKEGKAVERLRAHTGLLVVCEAASVMGCGCGFWNAEEAREWDPGAPDALRSLQFLRLYLAERVKEERALVAVTAWAGEEGRPVSRTIDVDPAFLGRECFDGWDARTTLIRLSQGG